VLLLLAEVLFAGGCLGIFVVPEGTLDEGG